MNALPVEQLYQLEQSLMKVQPAPSGHQKRALAPTESESYMGHYLGRDIDDFFSTIVQDCQGMSLNPRFQPLICSLQPRIRTEEAFAMNDLKRSNISFASPINEPIPYER
jgi:hypothetical protein